MVYSVYYCEDVVVSGGPTFLAYISYVMSLNQAPHEANPLSTSKLCFQVERKSEKNTLEFLVNIHIYNIHILSNGPEIIL